jgi:hypothetical protein
MIRRSRVCGHARNQPTDKFAVAGAHLPFPGIGHVVKAGTGYGYVPLFWAPG